MKYTYEDVITAKDILTGKVKKEDIIGNKGWFLDIIPSDMSLNTIGRIGSYGPLVDIQSEYAHLFVSFGNSGFMYFLPEKEESAAKPKFKIGDRVRIVKEWDGFGGSHKLTIGETGRIESVFDDAVKVRLDSDNDWWWYKPDAVEMIEDKAALSPVEGKDKPAYIPFDLSKEEDRDALRDKWIVCRYNGNEARISAFKQTDTRGWEAHIPQVGLRSGRQLFDNYTFLDGSLIGKLANSQQMK